MTAYDVEKIKVSMLREYGWIDNPAVCTINISMLKRLIHRINKLTYRVPVHHIAR